MEGLGQRGGPEYQPRKGWECLGILGNGVRVWGCGGLEAACSVTTVIWTAGWGLEDTGASLWLKNM